MKGLKQKREEKSVSQSWVALKLGVRRNTVCQWESGARFPRKDKLVQLAQLFSCSIEELL